MGLQDGRYIAPMGLEVRPAGEDSPPFWSLAKGQEFEFRDGYVWTDDFVVRASAGGLQGSLDHGWIERL
jgi:hypothetical protein